MNEPIFAGLPQGRGTARVLCLLLCCVFGIGAAWNAGAAPSGDWDRHVKERLQSQERQALIEQAQQERQAGVRTLPGAPEEAPPPEEPGFSVTISGYDKNHYTLVSLDELYAGEEKDVTVQVLKDGEAVGKGVPVRFEKNPAFPNLRDSLRRTDERGQIRIKDLRGQWGAGALRAKVDDQADVECAVAVHRRGQAPADGRDVAAVPVQDAADGQSAGEEARTAHAAKQSRPEQPAGAQDAAPTATAPVAAHEPDRNDPAAAQAPAAAAAQASVPTPAPAAPQVPAAAPVPATPAASAEIAAARPDARPKVPERLSLDCVNAPLALYTIAAEGFFLPDKPSALILTVKKEGGAPGADVPVRFEPDEAYPGLPQGYQRTDGQGRLRLANFRVAHGAGPLYIEVAGQPHAMCSPR